MTEESKEITITEVTVNAEALKDVLIALSGSGHLMRELQAIRVLGTSNPVDDLIASYNKDIINRKAEHFAPTFIKIPYAVFEESTLTYPCQGCEEQSVVEDIEDFNPDMHYCGGSPRCCP